MTRSHGFQPPFSLHLLRTFQRLTGAVGGCGELDQSRSERCPLRNCLMPATQNVCAAPLLRGGTDDRSSRRFGHQRGF
jgi:hypothetical protein